MNRLRRLLLAITVLWLATAVVAYASWQYSLSVRLPGALGRIDFIFFGFLSFFFTPFFTVILVGFLIIVLVWVGHIYEHPKFSPRHKNLIFIFAGSIFIILGAYLLNYTWTLQQNVNYVNEQISNPTNRIPVEMWQSLIDSWQPLILASASNGVIHVAISIVLFSFSRTRESTPRTLETGRG